jgi:deoxyribonuclease-4
MLLGVHVSIRDKIYRSFERAEELGCNTMQIFSRSPQRWRQSALEQGDVDEFVSFKERFNIKPVFVHIPYLINLASPNPRLYKGSIQAYIEDITEAGRLKVDHIVTHMGSHKDTLESFGLKRLIGALRKILKQTAGSKVGILLENTAGSGSWLGYKFKHQKKVIEALDFNPRIGFCLDTAHAFLAGYDLSSEEGLEKTLAEFDTMLGIKNLKLIHLNDAKNKLGSGHDQHEHIGKGKIGIEGIKRIINHPLLKDKPFILETPKKNAGDDAMNLQVVRQLRKAD